MKKFFSFLILIAVLWAGATTWIGRQFPQALQKYIDQLNEQMRPSGIRYTIASIDKGWFGSEVAIAVEPLDAGTQKLFETIPDPLRRLRWHVTYGPIFVRGGLGTGVAHLTSTIEYAPLRPLFAQSGFELDTAEGRLVFDATVGFDRDVTLHGTSDRIVMRDREANATFTVAPSTFGGKWNPWSYVGTYFMKTPTMRWERPAERISLEAEGVRFAADMDERLSRNLMSGEGGFTIDRLRIRSPKQTEPLMLIPTFSAYLHAEDNGTVAFGEELKVRIAEGALPGSAAAIRSLGVSVKLNGLAQDAVDAFLNKSREWQRKQFALINRLGQTPGDAAALAELMALNETVQREAEQIAVSLLRPKRTALDVHLAASNDPSAGDETNALDATMRLIAPLPKGQPRAALQQLIRTLPQYVSLDANATLATRFVQSLGPVGIRYTAMLEAAVKQGFVTRRNGRYTSSLHYTPTELILNGTPMPQVLMMVKMMGIGGLF
jgi:hypothetical protein